MSKDIDNIVDRYFAEVPYNLKKLIKAIGFPTFANIPDDEREVYERVQHGNCMTCCCKLGKNANFIVTRYGIVAGYCGGLCHSDMAVLGFLQEQHEVITSAIDFRGRGYPQADKAPVDVIPDSPGDDPAIGPDA
jgi:hypothetical protein